MDNDCSDKDVDDNADDVDDINGVSQKKVRTILFAER